MIVLEIERTGGKAIHIAADITNFSEIESLRRQTEKSFGPVDILVANAGGGLTASGPFEEISEEV